MLTIQSIAELRTQLASWRNQGRSLALVPTMGNLHAGHLHLVEQARKHAERVVVSVFVNPLQFGPGEDYDRYPRTLEEDRLQLEAIGADLLFAPLLTEIYPFPLAESTYVEVPVITEILCGAHRPGHFRGVTTVVAKLFNLVQPDVALFGEKDYQQLQVIRKMVTDLNFPVRVESVPIVREADGLALSSRNRYLNLQERALAPLLYQSLCKARDAIVGGEKDFVALSRQAMAFLENRGLQPEYFEIRRPDLSGATADDRPLVILAAARIGATRLIDNLSVP